MDGEFNVGSLRFRLGEFKRAIDEAIKKAKKDQLVTRIWAHDHKLWKPVPTEISNRLGWLDIAERMRSEIPALQDFVRGVKADGIDRVLLLGMGGSSLAPELFSKIFVIQGGLKLSVLDSTDPDAVREREKAHEPSRTLYIVSSKSGGTVETSSFFKYFYNKALGRLGAEKVGRHFIAITDPGSSLEKIGRQFGFRKVFLADANIGGRYSALSHFGLVPAALIGVDLMRLLSRAQQMAELCHNTEVNKNPAATLGMVLGTLALHGHDKATFILPDAKAGFGDWAEQLIAESTGKEGKGILPVVREPQIDNIEYGNDRVFISFEGAGNSPSIQIEWRDEFDIGAQFFLWEFATCVAGYALKINPFDQPNVESAKMQARSFIDSYKKTGVLPLTRSVTFTWSAIEEFLAAGQQGDYIAMQVYATPTSELTNAVQQLRMNLSQRSKLATTFGYGPRFLHSTGQLHKGDGGNGLFVQLITTPPKIDFPIPYEADEEASDITFGVLKVAQALGDAQALRDAGRRVVTFEIEGDLVSAIKSLLAV